MWEVIVGLLPGPRWLWLLVLFCIIVAFVIWTAATGF
jgi:hypothetical protein